MTAQGGEWQRWKGEWWIRVGRSSLNARQRRRISRDLRRLISREQNEVLRVLWELKNAMWKEGGRSSGGETEKTKGGDDDDDESKLGGQGRELGGDSGQY